jgi:hypothetical protein
MGSAGRWPAVFGGTPNTSGDTDWKNRTVFRATQPDGRRRAGDDSTRAALSPRSTVSLRLREPQAKFMKRNVTGDYVFMFIGKGKNVAFYDAYKTALPGGGYQAGTSYIQQPDVTKIVTVVEVGNELRVSPLVK